MAPFRERVPARPFAEWLRARVEFYERQQRAVKSWDRNALAQVAAECGWPGESGQRKLYRYLRELKSTKRGRRAKSMEVPAETYPRPVVEDALHHAGVDFYSIYPELAYERDIELEPAAWCPACQEHVTPIGGECPWDGWRIPAGHLNEQVAA